MYYNVKTLLKIEQLFQFNAKLDLRFYDRKNPYLKIIFEEVESKDLKNLLKFYEIPWKLAIQSEILNSPKYQINYILLINFKKVDEHTLLWECIGE